MGELDHFPPKLRLVTYRIWQGMMVAALLVAIGIGLFRSIN